MSKKAKKYLVTYTKRTVVKPTHWDIAYESKEFTTEDAAQKFATQVAAGELNSGDPAKGDGAVLYHTPKIVPVAA